MVAEWTTPESRIALVLDGGENHVGLVADFSSAQGSFSDYLVEEGADPETQTGVQESAPDTIENDSQPL